MSITSNTNSYLGGAVALNSGKVGDCVIYDKTVLPNKSAVGKNNGTIGSKVGERTTAQMKSGQFAYDMNYLCGTKTSNTKVWTYGGGYAVLAMLGDVATYKITFKNGSTTLSTLYSDSKGKVSFPANPTPPDGKVFEGWFSSGGAQVIGSTSFSKDETVSARFKDYVVESSSSEDGEAQSSSSVEVVDEEFSSSSENMELSSSGEITVSSSATEICSSSAGDDDAKSCSSEDGYVQSSSSVEVVDEEFSSSSENMELSSSSEITVSSSATEMSSSSEKTQSVYANINLGKYVYVSGRVVSFSGNLYGEYFSIFDMQGRPIKTGNLNSNNVQVTLPHVGMYIVHLNGNFWKISVK